MKARKMGSFDPKLDPQINEIIKTINAIDVTATDTIPVGSVTFIGYDTPPENWLECDGAAISRTEFSELFAKIGERFGTGDGSTTFNKPDLRGEGIVALMPIIKAKSIAGYDQIFVMVADALDAKEVAKLSKTLAEQAKNTAILKAQEAAASEASAKAAAEAALLSETNAASHEAGALLAVQGIGDNVTLSQTAAQTATDKALEASGYATNASTSATTAGTAKVDAESARDLSISAKDTAVIAKEDALTQAGYAQLSAEAADASELKASQWADSPAEVETNRFSAKYWADRARAITGGEQVDESAILHTQASGKFPVGYSTTEADDRYYQKSEVYTKAESDALTPTLPPTNVSFCFSGLSDLSGSFLDGGTIESPRYLVKSNKTITQVDVLGDNNLAMALELPYVVVEATPPPQSGSVEPTWAIDTPITDGQIVWMHNSADGVVSELWQPNTAYIAFMSMIFAAGGIWTPLGNGISGATEPDWDSVGAMEPLFDGTTMWYKVISVSIWQPNTGYVSSIDESGSAVVGSIGYGPVYFAIASGYLSGATEPAWGIDGAQDGEIYWAGGAYFETWLPNEGYPEGEIYVMPSTPNGYIYKMTTDGDGTTGATEPVWPTDGSRITDGDFSWELAGSQWSPSTRYAEGAIVYPITPVAGYEDALYVQSDKPLIAVPSISTRHIVYPSSTDVDAGKIIYTLMYTYTLAELNNVTIQVEMEDR